MLLALLLAVNTCPTPPCQALPTDTMMVTGAALEPVPADRVTTLTPNLACHAVTPAGKIVYRSRARRNLFRRMSGYPKGRPGYVVDHIVPLTCGGCDVPSNMQWQTLADSRAKDKTEKSGCGK
jgi:hypothetical protein